ncbi:SRPBCC domain-containing protein [Cystobacter fuscus]|uniref:SRPBCC family protein n=1 Tax=Cystobacter fuscus TaxID=43 RepID=UPI002B2B3C83|nr:SRPBCC domain-containing protein [Cystobacter fuscus]
MTPQAIRYEFHLRHAPERVWKALTTREAMAKWLMPNDFEPRLGHRFTFRREPIPQLDFDGIAHCEVIALERPRLLAFTFRGGVLDTRVSFRLEPEGDGTHLFFEHSGFDVNDPRQKFSFDAMGKGWSSLGEKLDEVVTASPAANC